MLTIDIYIYIYIHIEGCNFFIFRLATTLHFFFFSVSTSIFSAASASASDTNLADVNDYDHDDNNKYCQTEELLTAEGYCQTELDMPQLDREKKYMQYICDELSNTKAQLLSVQLTEEGFRDNDDTTKFYTGIPKFCLLMHVFNLIAPHIKRNCQNALSVSRVSFSFDKIKV